MNARGPITAETPLTLREQFFCDVYRGNATQAAIDCGFSVVSAGTLGYRTMKKPNVRAEIERQAKERMSAAIMDRDEMQKLFSATARDLRLPVRERLLAAQLLGKTRGDFSEKLELKGDLTLHELVREAVEGKPS